MTQHHRLLDVCVNFLKIFDFLLNVIYIRNFKSLVDAALIYNLSSFANCVNIHSFKSDRSNMKLIQVSYQHVIFFFFLLVLYVLACTFWEIYLQYILCHPHFVHTKTWETGNIISLCRSCTDIWIRWLCLFNRVPLTLKNVEPEKLWDCITWGCFSIQL